MIPSPEFFFPNLELSLDEKFVLKAGMIVDKNIDNTSFSVEQMANEMHLSRAQLFRRFKTILRQSPKDFITNIRLQRAANLIRARVDTIAQIGYSVGYSEQSYFTKRFRKKFGLTPTEYSDNQTKTDTKTFLKN